MCETGMWEFELFYFCTLLSVPKLFLSLTKGKEVPCFNKAGEILKPKHNGLFISFFNFGVVLQKWNDLRRIKDKKVAY